MVVGRVAVPDATMPLGCSFTARWFASFAGADQRQPEQRRNRNRIGLVRQLTGDDGLVLGFDGQARPSRYGPGARVWRPRVVPRPECPGDLDQTQESSPGLHHDLLRPSAKARSR